MQTISNAISNFDRRSCWAWALENIEWTKGPCVYQLYADANPHQISPEMYLGAWVETFIIMLLMSWIATAIWSEDVIARNRINDVMGYNNVCVGFDEAPARYVAEPGMVLMAYFGIRYVLLDNWRAKLQALAGQIAKKQYYFSTSANRLFACTMLLWPMLLLVTPGGREDWNLAYHFYIYVIFVVIAMMNIAANFVEAKDISIYSKIWLGAFVADTLLLLVVGAYAFNSYDYAACPNSLASSPDRANNATIDNLCIQEPRVPVWFLGGLDYMWFIFLGVTPLFLPDAPCITLAQGALLSNRTPSSGHNSLDEEEAGLGDMHVNLHTGAQI